MSARGFGSLVWAGAVAGAALGFYLVSLRVASERAALEGVETEIAMAQRDIRLLQTELGTRGRLAQLERWNVRFIRLSAPSADRSSLRLPAGDAVKRGPPRSRRRGAGLAPMRCRGPRVARFGRARSFAQVADGHIASYSAPSRWRRRSAHDTRPLVTSIVRRPQQQPRNCCGEAVKSRRPTDGALSSAGPRQGEGKSASLDALRHFPHQSMTRNRL